MNENIKAIIFDVDGTLTNSSSWQVLTEGLQADFSKVMFYYKKLRDGSIPLAEATLGVTEALSVKGPVEKVKLLQIYDAIPFKENLEIIIDNLKKKYKLCLISGSTDTYLESVARRLGIDDYFACSSFILSPSGVLKDFNYRVDQAQAKVEFLNRFCQKNDIKPSDCAAVGDSENDVELFKTVDKSVFIASPASTPGLKRFAKYEIRDISELLTIF